jgi:hypothetical protein
LSLTCRFPRVQRCSSFVGEEEAKKANVGRKALEIAMRQLFQEGKIWNEPWGRLSRPAYRIAIKA